MLGSAQSQTELQVKVQLLVCTHLGNYTSLRCLLWYDCLEKMVHQECWVQRGVHVCEEKGAMFCSPDHAQGLSVCRLCPDVLSLPWEEGHRDPSKTPVSMHKEPTLYPETDSVIWKWKFSTFFQWSDWHCLETTEQLFETVACFKAALCLGKKATDECLP